MSFTLTAIENCDPVAGDWGTPMAQLAIAECLHVLRLERAELERKLAYVLVCQAREQYEKDTGK